MNLISSPRPTAGLPGLNGANAPAVAADTKTGPTFGELLDGQMTPAKASDKTPDRPDQAARATPAEAPAPAPAAATATAPSEAARSPTGSKDHAEIPAKSDAAPVAAQLLDMLDLVQQVRSGGNLSGKPAPATPVAASSELVTPGQTPAVTTTIPPAPPQENPPPQPATAPTPAATQAAAIATAAAAAQQAQTVTTAADRPSPVTSTQARARDDEETATDSETPATTPLPDAVTLALLAAGQMQPVAQQQRPPPASPSDRQANAGTPDAGSLAAHASPAGDGRASAAALLTTQPGQEEMVAGAQNAATRKTATQATAATAEPLQPEPSTDTKLENNAATRFETRMAAQTEPATGAEQPAANLPVSAASVGASLAPTGTAAHTAAPVQHQILTGFGNRGWDQAVSQRVLWLAQDQLQQASLTLNPPHLGPVQVTVQIDNQQAMIQFVSNQPEVRQALQDALPVLREMFGQAGIALGQADVSSRNPDQGQARQSSSGKPGVSDEPDLALDGLTTLLPSAAGQGLINLFA